MCGGGTAAAGVLQVLNWSEMLHKVAIVACHK